MTLRPRPTALIILDGFGARPDAPDNAVTRAPMPFWRHLCHTAPTTTLSASADSVGLPDGQMGNSEVGHLNIGAGRVVWQDLTRIDQAIGMALFGAASELTDAKALHDMVETLKASGKTLHVFGLLSAGGVHSHENHIFGVIDILAQTGVPRIRVHAFLDGRDTPPKSAMGSIETLDGLCSQFADNRVKIASICGRYFAMDRDRRWERTEKAYDLIVAGTAAFTFPDAVTALSSAYDRNETDEFVAPSALLGDETYQVNDGDAVLFMNFRADRARQITRAIVDPAFSGFTRKKIVTPAAFVTLTEYDKTLALPVIFPPQTIENGLGEYVSKLGLKQLRIAETEKYAHVTYFLSGGVETVLEGEDRVLVPSPKVATYDLQPEMSAVEVTDKLVEAILSKRYDLIVANFANGDMVGHTGIMEAAIKALATLDTCLSRVVTAIKEAGGEALITADHGNAEMMFDPSTNQPHTAHTLNPVPLVFVGREGATLSEGGALCDLAPTLLAMMGLEVPKEMNGRVLIRFTT